MRTILQCFEWYLPSDGSLWTQLSKQAKTLKEVGFNSVWLPPAYKGNHGKEDVGYGVYDIYDLGEFNQKNTIRTKYGTKDEYLKLIESFHQNKIEVLADIVLNHKMGADEAEKVKACEMDWCHRNTRISDEKEIEVWTKFTFPGRKNTYSDFKWNWDCFTGTDYDATNDKTVLLTFNGKKWQKGVSREQDNFDFIMGDDIDFENPIVVDELMKWGKWYVNMTKVDGYRLDAIKSIDYHFFEKWLQSQREYVDERSFAVGEYWSGYIGYLIDYLFLTNYCMSLFDVTFHFKLYDACHIASEFDMGTILKDTLMDREPNYAVPFVDNHDTQPGQALQSWIDGWFKQQAYALTLLHGAQDVCVFYGDYYGIPHDHIGVVTGLKEMVWLRSQMHDFTIVDRFDDFDCIGWLVQQEHPIVVVLTNGIGKSKEFIIENKPNTEFVDILHHQNDVKTDENGKSFFACCDGSCSIYIEKEYLDILRRELKMKLAMACDHGAYVYKNELKEMLQNEGYEIIDCGCNGPESVDYPDYAKAAATLVANGEVDKGIVLCGTGIGISIAANKVKGIRCALCTDVTMAKLTREHNNANMLAMGQRTTGIETCKDIVHTFLNTPFSEGERHIKRIEKITQMESE